MAKYINMQKEDLLNIFNFNSYSPSAVLNYQNKETWNGFIFYETAREVVNALDNLGYNILGFCDAPYSDGDFDKAIILEAYDQDYDIYWCHASNFLILQWRCSLTGEDLFDVIEKFEKETGQKI